MEVYLHTYYGNLYQRELKIDIMERLRDEKRFDSADELKKQMAKDVKQGLTVLSSRGKH